MKPKKKVRVVIADDHAILRSGLRLLINSQPDMEAVSEAADWDAAERELAQQAPDVLTVDLSMPGGDVFTRLRRLRKLAVATRLIVLTMHADAAYFRAAIAAGADGYVLKTSADEELLAAIRCVAAGGIYAAAALGAATEAAPAAGGPPRAATELSVLSSREREVLQAAARGRTNREIAEDLFLSVKTVESYRSRLMAKLGLASRADLVAYAIRHGLLATE